MHGNVTLEVKAGDSTGMLYLHEGDLIDAETGNLRNRAAAYRIISWDETEIELRDAGKKNQNKINQSLVEVLVEALRLRTLRSGQDQPQAKKDEGKSKSAKVKSPRSYRKEKSPDTSTNGRYEALMEAAQDGKGGRWKTILAVALFTLLVFIAGGKFALHVIEARTLKSNFAELIAEVAEEEDLNLKLEILQEYKEELTATEYSALIEKELQAIRSQLEEQDYNNLVTEVSELPIDADYEEIATELYNAYIDKYPVGHRTADIQDRLAGIPQLIDDIDYKKLKDAVRLDYENRIEVYLGYLIKHPDGRYKRKVESFISEMSDDYYSLLMQKADQCDRDQKWDSCIVLCDNFLNYFERDYRADEIEYIKWEMEDKKAFNRLLAKVSKAGSNYQKAKKILVEYLEQNPDTIKAEEIKNDISRLDRRINRLADWRKVAAYSQNSDFNVAERINYMQMYLQQNPAGPFLGEANSILSRLQDEYRYARQQQADAVQKNQAAKAQREKVRLENELKKMMSRVQKSGGRYRLNGDGTFTDTQTGLIWALLDSKAELGNCQNYNSAKNYVAGLQTGGYHDWRMPQGSELTGLYKTDQSFPQSGSPWYWTSERIDRGYHRQALVVTTKKEKVFKRRQKDLKSCGAVRAVRP